MRGNLLPANWSNIQNVIVINVGDAELFAPFAGACQALGPTAMARDVGMVRDIGLEMDADARLSIAQRIALAKAMHIETP